MTIILKYILKNIKEKKFRSLLITFSLTLSVIILTICLTLKDNVVAQYTEFLMKTSGTSDISITKDIPFEKEKMDNLSSNYHQVPFMNYMDGKDTIFGANIEDLQRNKMIKTNQIDNLKDDEVIIGKKIADSKSLKKNDTIRIGNKDLKIVEVAQEYGIFVGETKEKPVYLTTIKFANDCMYESLSEEQKMQFDKNKLYLNGAFIDVIDDDLELAKQDLKNIDNNFVVSKIKTSIEEEVNQINSLMIIMLVVTTLIAFYIISSILKLVLEERMAVIGTFRSIGASKRKTNLLLYLENSFYGIISSIIGIFIANLLIEPVTNAVISSGDLELTSKAGINPLYIIIVVMFTILVQIFITYIQLRKNKNKSIKDIIFETQDTKYKMSQKKIIIGVLLIIVSVILYVINTNYDFMLGLLSIVLLVIGFILAIPLGIKAIAKLLSLMLKNKRTSYMACKNIADNKILLSSTILLFIIIAMTTMIYNVSVTVTNTYAAFDKITHYTMRISGLSEKESEYEYIKDIEGVKELAFYYCTWDSFKINDIEKIFALVGYDREDDNLYKLCESIEFNKNEADELKEDEILLDEAFAIKNGYKIGDKIKIDNQYFKEEFTFTIKGYIDATNTTSMRTVAMLTKDKYIKLFGDSYFKTILINSDLPDDTLKDNLKNGIKDENVEIISYQEWMESDIENTNQIMNIVYVILILGTGLAMIGLVNNGLVAFGQRKRSLAVLNSICMTKRQLYKMAIEENIFSFIIAAIPGVILSKILNIYLEKTMGGMGMFLNMAFDRKGVFLLVIIILVLTIVEAIVPIRKIKKLDLVKEIKYE